MAQRRGLIALATSISFATWACTSTTHVYVAAPPPGAVARPQIEACVASCSHGSDRLTCLRHCPGAREREGTCEADAPPRTLACAEGHATDGSGAAAAVLIVVTLLALGVVVAADSLPSGLDARRTR